MQKQTQNEKNIYLLKIIKSKKVLFKCQSLYKIRTFHKFTAELLVGDKDISHSK